MQKLLLVILFFYFSAGAQTISPSVINTSSGGGALGATGIEVYDNVGEPILSTINNTNNAITQGFLQPDIVGRFGLAATVFVTPNSCADKADGSIVVSSFVSGSNDQSNYKMSYFWSPSSYCQSSTTCSKITDLPSGTYSVLVVSHYIGGGSALPNDTVRIASVIVSGSAEICEINIYNGLSINGDGKNDFFAIQNIENFPNNHVEIYNRWGQKLADFKPYDNADNSWKGTMNDTGILAPSGTYFYVIDLGNGSKPIKGWLELTGS